MATPVRTLLLLAAGVLSIPARAQDSVDVTFRYRPVGPVSSVHLTGEFVNWSPSALPMTRTDDGVFLRTRRLRMGGHPGGKVEGAYQFKFFTGEVPWPNDPLHHYVNPQDNDNSVLYVQHPTFYQFTPNQFSGVVTSPNPVISVFLFPKVGAEVDTGSITLRIGDRLYSGLGASYDSESRRFSFRVPDPLGNGTHKAWLSAGGVVDSVSFILQAGFVQITNVGDFMTRKPEWTLYGAVEDTSVRSVRIVRNEADTIDAAVSGGRFTHTVALIEGLNSFKALARDASDSLRVSDPVRYTYFVNHAPAAVIDLSQSQSTVILSAEGSSDPDSGQSSQLGFEWYEDDRNPVLLGVHGRGERTLSVPTPKAPGEYTFTLVATDPDGNKDTTSSYFTIAPDGTFAPATLASVPHWVKTGRVYEVFFKSLTPGGTINDALSFLPYFKSLGVSILWIMPVMHNAHPINNQTGPGYNIKDFFRVAPEYGTNDDFKNFVRRAHELGLKVILDVTPNHTSYLHPFAVQAKQFRENSPYWNFYQHTAVDHNTNGLGLCESEGFYYYCGFSSQLLNFNWGDIDARTYMTEVYKWWIREFDLDGYRFDVYWGPRRRAGGDYNRGNESQMGIPVRRELKKLKPGIFLLAEDDGTGIGTEVIYADQGGGADAGYDWNLYWQLLHPFYQLTETQREQRFYDRITNFGYYPGPNAHYLRFLENHDEERIVVQYGGSYRRTMPLATVLFTAPGIPMIYSGQEVGFGPGERDFFRRTRGVIDWNAPGRSLLLPHYQRLAHVRARFPAFSTQAFRRISGTVSPLFAFSRPYAGADGIVIVNADSSHRTVSLPLNSSVLASALQEGRTYFANDVANDTSYHLTVSGGGAVLNFEIEPYGSAVFVIAESLITLRPPTLVTVDRWELPPGSPRQFQLYNAYPNPFNSSTTMVFELPRRSVVSLRIYSVLGAEVAVLVDDALPPGKHTVRWEGRDAAGRALPSGVYFARLQSEEMSVVRKLLILR